MHVRDYHLKRALFGPDPKAVRAALDQLDQFYRQHELVLASHRWEMAGLIDLLKPAVSSMESTITALAPGQAPPPPPRVSHAATVPPLPVPPRLPTLATRAGGYQRRSVQKAWERLRSEWERQLTLRGQEVAALEEQRWTLMMRMINAQQKLKDLRLEALLPVLDRRLRQLSQLPDFTQSFPSQGMPDPQPVDETAAALMPAEEAPAPAPPEEAPAPVEEAPAPAPAPAPPITLPRVTVPAGAAPVRKTSGRAGVWKPGMVEVEAGDGATALTPRHSRGISVQGARFQVPQVPVAQPVAAPAPVAAPVVQTAAPVYQAPAPQPAPPPTAPIIPAPAPGALSNLEAQVQAGLSSRLEVLFQRFLVGKVLGADLSLPNGQLLAVKGTEITRDMVQVAEENGVLPALIAHMVLPGSAAD